jgi:hypothetical protein
VLKLAQSLGLDLLAQIDMDDGVGGGEIMTLSSMKSPRQLSCAGEEQFHAFSGPEF